ncbi:hypothetical protein [uncultured Alistipes sp.]|jgi:hypothetical protein|uniref:helix-turn-helix transcriptional regulator n=1 Tax=uncultured Alistipes sp. TaxID=538949 RepID=UPI0025F978C5|nr:hypothetical protein [uncultured Alistipes sp.]
MLNQLLHSITHYSSLGLIICAIVLLVRYRQDPATRILITVFFVGGAIALAYMLKTYGLTILDPTMLNPKVLVSGGISGLLLCYYPVALVRIDLFKFRFILLSLVPLALQLLILYIAARSGMQYRTLTSFSDIADHIAEPNVWLRLILFALANTYLIALAVFGIVALRRKAVVHPIPFAISAFGPLGMVVFFALGNLFFPIAGKVLNQCYILLYCVVLTYFVIKSKKSSGAYGRDEKPETQGRLIEFMAGAPSRLMTSEREMEFRQRFTQAYPSFSPRLKSICPGITLTEETLSMLIHMNISNQEIAYILGINLASVHTSRSRLKKKLGVGKSDSIDEFIRDI